MSKSPRNPNYTYNSGIGPGNYDPKESNQPKAPKFSFGLKSTGEIIKVKHSVPLHLQRNNGFFSPGPGTYSASSSFRSPRRELESTQDCTWQRASANVGLLLTKDNPGPGHYRYEDASIVEQKNKCF